MSIEENGTKGKVSTKRTLSARLAWCLLPLLLSTACQQKMAHQPYYRPLEETEFYPDHRSARPIERGTISIDQAAEDDSLVSGLSTAGRSSRPRGEGVAAIPAGAPDRVSNYVDEFPFEITSKDLQRGMERYTIFCTPCHSPLGDGRGKIVERGYLKPTSYLGENSRGFGRYSVTLPLRDAPVGYYFEVITRGYGGMPDYAQQIPPADRWRIIAYIRALQLSQSANFSDLPANVQDAARKAADEASKEPVGGHHP